MVLICASMNASFYLVRLIRTLRSTSLSHKILTFKSLVVRKQPEIAWGHFRVWLLWLVGLVFRSFKWKLSCGLLSGSGSHQLLLPFSWPRLSVLIYFCDGCGTTAMTLQRPQVRCCWLVLPSCHLTSGVLSIHWSCKLSASWAGPLPCDSSCVFPRHSI